MQMSVWKPFETRPHNNVSGARRVAHQCLARESRHTDSNKSVPIHTQHVERGRALWKEHECPHTACGRRERLRETSTNRSSEVTAGDQTNQDSSESDAKHDGTQSFPRAETVLVAMQQSDARQSRGECFRGRTQLQANVTRKLMPQNS